MIKVSMKILAASSLLVFAGCQHLPANKVKTKDQKQEPATQLLPVKTKNKATTLQTGTLQAATSVSSKKTLVSLPPAVAPNAWEHILAKPGIEIAHNRRILAEKKWYLQHTGFLSRVFQRTETLLPYVLQELDRRGLPRALALLPIVESSYNPQAISKAGAIGTWQFMPATAKYYGLKMNWWYDGRRDVIASTDAALRYLSQLEKRFDGDWLLALASYNAGGGNVNRSIRRKYSHSSKKVTPSFWKLRLPTETSKYVPRLLALLEIIEEADQHGVKLPKMPAQPLIQVVHTQGQIELQQAARLAGISLKDFKELNPGFRRWASDPIGPHKILLPTTQVKKFKQGLQRLPANQRMTWHRHKVKPGDTISEIAANYDLPTAEIKRINNLQSSFIRVGQRLMVPEGRVAQQLAQVTIPSKAKKSLARQLSTKQSKLAKTKTQKTSNQSSIDHKIRQGDTLWELSRQYNTSVKAIAKENKLAANANLRLGQILTIPLSDGLWSQKVSYQVQGGDSLYKIAQRFNVSIKEIASWNALDRRSHIIKPGQQLTLFVGN